MKSGNKKNVQTKSYVYWRSSEIVCGFFYAENRHILFGQRNFPV